MTVNVYNQSAQFITRESNFTRITVRKIEIKLFNNHYYGLTIILNRMGCQLIFGYPFACAGLRLQHRQHSYTGPDDSVELKDNPGLPPVGEVRFPGGQTWTHAGMHAIKPHRYFLKADGQVWPKPAPIWI
jgi:hypothetical protein